MDASEPRYSIETLVEALYRAILLRPPHEEGLWNNIRRLTSLRANATDLTKFIKGFLESQEYKEKAARQFIQRLMDTSTLANGESIDFVSLGSHCLVSYALKEMGLKRYSCPFDWIFSKPSMVQHCIRDSFATLADRSQYQPVIDQRGIELRGLCHHAYYRNSFGVDRVFNHRDMRIDENYQYFLRCIDRFTKLLASDSRKVFVLLCSEPRIGYGQFLSFYNTLSEATSNFWLLFLILREPEMNIYNFGIDFIDYIGPSCLATMRSISKAGGIAFEDPFDDFMFRRAVVTFASSAMPSHTTTQ